MGILDALSLVRKTVVLICLRNRRRELDATDEERSECVSQLRIGPSPQRIPPEMQQEDTVVHPPSGESLLPECGMHGSNPREYSQSASLLAGSN